MVKALALSSPASFDDDVVPLMLGNLLHLDAANAVGDAESLSWPDYWGGEVFGPRGAYVPQVVVEDDIPHVAIRGVSETANDGSIACAPWGRFSGVGEMSGYMAARLVGVADSGRLLSFVGTSSPARNIMLRRSGTANLQFQVSSATAGNATIGTYTLATWTLLGFGFSVSKQKLFISLGDTEVEVDGAGFEAITGSEGLVLGKAQTNTAQSVDFDLRGLLVLRGYHSATVRQEFRDMMRERYRID